MYLGGGGGSVNWNREECGELNTHDPKCLLHNAVVSYHYDNDSS